MTPRTTPTKLAVFTGDLAYSVRKGIVEIDRAVEGLEWLIVLQRPRKPARQLLRNQWRNLRRNGWRWIPYQAHDAWRRIVAGAPANAPACATGRAYSLAALRDNPRVRLLEVPNIHAAETLAEVRTFAPMLGLSLAAPILRRALFAIPELGTINLHKGKVPDYRGMPPAFWELWNDESEVGCTVHWVDDKLDTGAVAGQAVVQRDRYASLRGLQLSLDESGIALMSGAVRAILSGATQAAPQGQGGTTYRKPTLAQVAALERKMARVTAPTSPSLPKRLAKAALAIGAGALQGIGAQRALRPRITVLLYHRVSDAARDNLTVGVAQFESQMAWLRRHCELLSIEEVLACKTIPRSRRPLVCVTFDDGYVDNYLHAVPALLRHEVPAAFFVSTGIVGTAQSFPHDVRRGNPAIPNLDWDQLRAMRAHGFTIGSHTVNHIDCAGEPEATVWNELNQSRDDLRRELGLGDVILGYPYGGRQHMTAQRLDLVKQAGYVGCLSAYGGSNVGGVDPFDVRRRGIHWEFFDRAFRVECLGWR
jgi:peptidoglycan/xylan/chitin deacetylase (PgdA/CDA1 family)